MKTLETGNIPVEQLDALEEFAESTAGPELRDVLLSLSSFVREGDETVGLDAGSKTVTPNQAAARLGMSRTHLYKLLDRRELAERFAQQRETAAAATDEIADLL